MKKLLVSVLSVLAMTVLVASPVMADDWGSIETPFTNGQINRRVQWVGPMEKAINGELYVAVGLRSPNEVILYKSSDFGRKWIELGGQPFDSDSVVGERSGVIFDIECSAVNANIVYVTDGHDIFKSANGGKTWARMDNLFDENLDAQGYIVSIASGTFGNTNYLFAATSTFGGGIGGAYVLQESLFISKWIDLGIAVDREDVMGQIDVLAIDTLPDFSTTQGVIAVVSDYDNDRTLVTSRFGASEWGQEFGDIVLAYNLPDGSQLAVDDVLLDATIWFPSNFSSDPSTGNSVLFVGLNPENEVAQGDVYQCFLGASSDDVQLAYDMDVRGQASGTGVSDMDGVGTWVDADLLISGYGEATGVPRTWASQDGGITWIQDAKRPTGGRSPLFPVALSSVRVAPDFATSGKALVGTHGMDCGLSISYLPTDVCATGFTWNTIYFINSCAAFEQIDPDYLQYSIEMSQAQQALADGRSDVAFIHYAAAWQHAIALSE